MVIALRVAALLTAALVGATGSGPGSEPKLWNPDRGDGTYVNPVLFADYSDPDVVRVGDDFFLVSSSFSSVPALPILHSKDLVNWTIIGHAAARLPSPDFDTPQHGKGIWAPSLRHHAGKFWIYVGDPDRGIYVTTAKNARGPWAPLILVKPAKGAIDPCPLWDDDGRMYLVHAWAKSRAGFNSVLTVTPLSGDGLRVEGRDVAVFDGHANHPTIEGPKFYKRNGWYYIFAPAGGVATGWQTVLRSKSVMGPYEDRIVLRQGRTKVNGPHQGGWVETKSGESWFLHFQDRGAYGRVVHLQPMVWKSDWPVIGADPDGDGVGEPVATFRKPVAGAAAIMPATSDEFAAKALGVQWQWNANPSADWISLSARSGQLRLFAGTPAGNHGTGNVLDLPNLLLQKVPAESFRVTTVVDVDGLASGSTAGLVVAGRDTAAIIVRRTGQDFSVAPLVGKDVDKEGRDVTGVANPLESARVWLRATFESVDPSTGTPADSPQGPSASSAADRPRVRFSYSADGVRFREIGESFSSRPGVWVGARVGLFVTSSAATPKSFAGHADFDWFRFEALR
jgi:beta-xylosidase